MKYNVIFLHHTSLNKSSSEEKKKQNDYCIEYDFIIFNYLKYL